MLLADKREFWEVCAKCPYDKGETFQRKDRLESIYGNWQPEYCFCDKVDGVHWRYGWCNEPFENVKLKTRKYSGKRKTGRAYRRVMKQQKDDQLLHIIRRYYIPHAGYTSLFDFDGDSLKGTGVYIKYQSKNS